MNAPVVDQHIIHFEVSTFTVFNLRKESKKARKLLFIDLKLLVTTFHCKEVESKIDSTVSHNYCQRAIRAKTLGWRGGSRIEPRKTGQ